MGYITIERLLLGFMSFEFQTGFKFGLSAVVFSWDLEEHLIVAGDLTNIFIYLTLYAYVLLNSRRDFLSI